MVGVAARRVAHLALLEDGQQQLVGDVRFVEEHLLALLVREAEQHRVLHRDGGHGLAGARRHVQALGVEEGAGVHRRAVGVLDAAAEEEVERVVDPLDGLVLLGRDDLVALRDHHLLGPLQQVGGAQQAVGDRRVRGDRVVEHRVVVDRARRRVEEPPLREHVDVLEQLVLDELLGVVERLEGLRAVEDLPLAEAAAHRLVHPRPHELDAAPLRQRAHLGERGVGGGVDRRDARHVDDEHLAALAPLLLLELALEVLLEELDHPRRRPEENEAVDAQDGVPRAEHAELHLLRRRAHRRRRVLLAADDRAEVGLGGEVDRERHRRPHDAGEQSLPELAEHVDHEDQPDA